MAKYYDDKKVCKFDVGIVNGIFWWAKDTELLIVSLENVYLNYFEKKFNKLNEIKINFRKPLKSEMVYFNSKNNSFLGRTRTEEGVKRIILTNCYFYKNRY